MTTLSVCPSPGSLRGVDVSTFQGAIDWTQVAQAGISFGYARAMDGTTFIDPTFQTNFAGMKSAGVKRGAYIYFEPGQDPTAQANAFLSSLSQAGFTFGDLIPAIDVEVTGGLPPSILESKLQTMVQTIQAALGVRPVIYTAAGFWNSSVGSAAFAGNPLWIANWGVACPTIPHGWTTWTLWQYSDAGSVPGIPGSVDLDQSNGPTLPIFNSQDQVLSVAPLPISPTEGLAFSGQVAAGFNPSPNPLQATIAWGDGATSSGTVTPSGKTFTVNGTHTYAEQGNYTLTVTVSDRQGHNATNSVAVEVKDAPLTLTSLIVQGTDALMGILNKATFSDANPLSTAAEFTATIDWGDYTTSTVPVLRLGSGSYRVKNTKHTYASAGSYTVTFTVRDEGNPLFGGVSQATGSQTIKVSSSCLD